MAHEAPNSAGREAKFEDGKIGRWTWALLITLQTGCKLSQTPAAGLSALTTGFEDLQVETQRT